MPIEIPTFTRCCCCLPLRRGIIVLGYLSLVLAIFYICIEFLYEMSWTEETISLFRGATFNASKWFPVFLYFIEIIFILFLLVGAHTNRPALMTAYYYYGITTTAAALAVFLISIPSNHEDHLFPDPNFYYFYHLVDVVTMFIGIVTEVYLLLLIRSELRKPCTSLRYVNHLDEVCVQSVRNNGVNFI